MSYENKERRSVSKEGNNKANPSIKDQLGNRDMPSMFTRRFRCKLDCLHLLSACVLVCLFGLFFFSTALANLTSLPVIKAKGC